MGKRGIALITSYMVIAVLTILAAIIVSRSIAERNVSRRHSDSMQAFWIAEAGLADTMTQVRAVQTWRPNGLPQNFGGGNYTLTFNDLGSEVEFMSTGTFNNTTRRLKGSLVRIPSPFLNTVSSGGNLVLQGLLAKVEIYGRTRISGTYSQSFGTSGWFADLQQGVATSQTKITIPDYNVNGTADEFNDFKAFGNQVLGRYPSDQVVHVQDNGTVNIFPNSALTGKKVVFVEGSGVGQGNVNIWFDGTWSEGEDLTVIATGAITYIEPLQFQTNARLSTISWGKYAEVSVFRSEHESVIYTHNDANFVDILDWGSTTGNVIANGNISLKEVLTYEKYYYSDKAANGNMPPGFSLLANASGVLSTNKLSNWQEW